MADRNEALLLQMSVQLNRIEAQMARAGGIVDKGLKNVEARFDRMNAHVRRAGDQMSKDLRSSIAAIGVGLAIRETVGLADAWATARNKLAAAGVANEKLSATMADLSELSQSTRTGFEQTLDLYAKLTRATDKLGLSQEQVRRITETTLQGFVAGGATLQEQASGILQLSQALGSGLLQGDELKSLRENAPLLAQAIADEFDTTIAGLKKLGAEGELTSARVAKAILNAKGITEGFNRTTTTTAQAMTNLRTAFIRYLGESEKVGAATQALNGFLKFAAENFNTLANAAIVAATVFGGTLAAGAIAKLIQALAVLSAGMATAAGRAVALRTAMSFFGGPLGAAVLAIGAALGSMALNAEEASVSFADAEASLSKLKTAQAALESETDSLKAATERLNEAIAAGGAAAQNAAALEVDALNKRIAANENLRDVYIAQTRAQIAQLRATAGIPQERRQRLADLAQQIYPDLPPEGYVPLARQRLVDTTRQLGFSALTDNQRELFTLIAEFEGAMARLQELEATLAQLEFGRSANDSIRGQASALRSGAMAESGGGGGVAGAASNLKGYRTEAEKLTSALKPLQAEIDGETERVRKAAEAYEWLSTVRRIWSADITPAERAPLLQQRGITLDDVNFAGQSTDAQDLAALDAVSADVAARRAERSREAVSALLDYIKAVDDATLATQALAEWRHLLTEQDVAAHLQPEIDKLREYKVVVDTNIEDAPEPNRNIVRDVMGYDPQGRVDQILDASGRWLDDYAREEEAARERIRNAVRDGLKQGITDDNWGEALRSALAEIVTSAFDRSIQMLSDALYQLAMGNAQTGQQGWISSFANWAGAAFAGGGARASGGPATEGRIYRVNEFNEEYLALGKGVNGRVVNANQMKGLRGGGGGLSAPITFTGDIDASTLPQVAAMLAEHRRQIMAAIPGAVDGRIAYGKKNRISPYR